MASSARQRTRQAQGKPTEPKSAAFKVQVDGEELVIDRATFTGNEQRLIKREMARLGYPADSEDRAYAAIWIVMRRTETNLTFDDFLDMITVGDLSTLEEADGSGDDSPEA